MTAAFEGSLPLCTPLSNAKQQLLTSLPVTFLLRLAASLLCNPSVQWGVMPNSFLSVQMVCVVCQGFPHVWTITRLQRLDPEHVADEAESTDLGQSSSIFFFFLWI